MRVKSLLTLTHCLFKPSNVVNKKQAFEVLSKAICQTNDTLKVQDIMQALQQRERLGSTALGHGVAIPHARLSELAEPIVVFLLLDTAISFDRENENARADIIAALLVPEQATQTHLDMLSTLSQLLASGAVRQQLRYTESQQQLFDVLMDNLPS